MVPFDVELEGARVGITWESLFWFFIVTTLATFAGTVVYYYLQPYLPAPVQQTNSNTRTQQKVTSGSGQS